MKTLIGVVMDAGGHSPSDYGSCAMPRQTLPLVAIGNLSQLHTLERTYHKLQVSTCITTQQTV